MRSLALVEKRYLTLEDADALLVKIKPLIKKLQDIDDALEIFDSVEIEYDDSHSDAYFEIQRNKRYHKLYLEFYKILESLLEKGCIVKDVEEGLIDFYSMCDGREIFLCWHLGEKKIKFWHEIETGFQGRKPISLLKKN